MFDFKGKGKKLDGAMKEAKMSALGGLSDEMSKMLGEGLKGAKKVSVVAKDQEGLEEGLDKAKEMVEGSEEMCPECGGKHEGPEHESEMSLPDDLEGLEKLIQAAMSKKESLIKE